MSDSRAVIIDGVAVKPDDAKVSVYDRGFLYGDAVFEVVRVYGGSPFALREHLERLRASAVSVFIELGISDEALAAEVHEAITRAGGGDLYVRIQVSRGMGPFGYAIVRATDPGQPLHVPTRVVLVEPLRPPSRETYQHGIRTIARPIWRPTDRTRAAGAKYATYLPSILAAAEATRLGAEEALVIDEAGHVLEGTTSNVFVVRSGTVWTPPLATGILPGITRRTILEVAAGAGIRVSEELFTVGDMTASDEAFITSTIREVVPVVAVDERTVGQGQPGPLTRKLHEALRRRIGASGPEPWE